MDGSGSKNDVSDVVDDTGCLTDSRMAAESTIMQQFVNGITCRYLVAYLGHGIRRVCRRAAEQ